MTRILGYVALALALLICLAFPFVFPAISVDDSPSYLNPAREWAAGRGLSQADGTPLQYRLPLYPLLLGFTLRFAGDSPIAIGFLNVALHATSVLLVLSVLPGRPRSIFLCAAALVYPPLLTTTGLVLQESLIAFTLSALFATVTRALRSGAHPAWAFAAGLALGGSALAKTTALPAGAMLFFLLCRCTSVRRQGLPFLLGAILMMVPWTVHNRLVLGRFEFSNANAGVALFGGTVDNVLLPSWDRFPEYLEARDRWEREGREAEPVFDRYLARLAFERIAAHPVRWTALASERVVRFMLPARHWFVATGRSQPATVSPPYLAAIAVQLTLFGACVLLLRDGLAAPHNATALVAPLIVFSHQLVYAASHSSPRYGATVGPLLFAALALVVVPPSLRARRIVRAH